MSLVIDVPSSMEPKRSTDGGQDARWIVAAGYLTWLVCALRPMIEITAGRFAGWRATGWLASYTIFGLALTGTVVIPAIGARGRAFRLSLLVVQSVTGLMAVFLSGNGTTSALLVIVAAQVPHLLPLRSAVIWVGVQAIVNAIGFARYNWINGVTGVIVIGGFQAFALASSVFASRERAARHKLAAANGELLATRTRLAESSRAEERLRIARDLHDTLGHHLAALSLQLDVASRLAHGQAATHVSEAHGIARLLLSDVRDVVGQMREERRVDLSDALRALAAASHDPIVHLSLPASLEISDESRSQALLRGVQEIVTNAVRHSAARNVWIEVELRGDGIELSSRDDGRGAGSVAPGHGLMGMRERFEACGGRVAFSTSIGQGFQVRAFIPHRWTAS
jgi:signal transduction histidine kinase